MTNGDFMDSTTKMSIAKFLLLLNYILFVHESRKDAIVVKYSSNNKLCSIRN